MIIVSGAAGFIGSCLVGGLNEAGHKDLVLVDDFSRPGKRDNYIHKAFQTRVNRSELADWLTRHGKKVKRVIHLGARTDTAERDESLFNELNLNYSKMLWNWCCQAGVPLIYASSAATYGDGRLGFSDEAELIPQFQPLNLYGWSKQHFDLWALEQKQKPPHWYGLKFFNVYGPNEYHKGRMASVIYHTYRQIQASGSMRLFRSHRPDFADGEQARDFIYVMDIISVIQFLMKDLAPSGIYNLGTGKARTFNDLARGVFDSLGIEANISYIDTPEDIREAYQYFTEASMEKLLAAGYSEPFTQLEDGIRAYVQQFLSLGKYY